ncbi:MAG: hypothetical protein QXE05_09235, partial [Nitrososphaeria archaeon]
MMIKKNVEGISSFRTVQHKKEPENIHPFSHQLLHTVEERVTTHPLLTRPTKQAIYPEHPIGMPSFDWYKQRQNETQQNKSILRTTGLTQINPFTKGLGGLGGLGPVGGNISLTKTPENTLPFKWHGYATPTLPPTEKTTETPTPKWLPLKWRGIGIVKPPTEKTTIPEWHPTHGVPTEPPNQGTQKSTSTQPTEPTQPQIDTNADYGVLGAIVMMLLP